MHLTQQEEKQGAGAVTQLLQRAQVGDDHAASELMPLIYRELHVLAARYMQRERPNHTLQPTVLVHEAFLQLVAADSIDWQGRAHFFALAARAMRRILIDHARSAKADKRPGGHQQVELHSYMRVVDQSVNVLAMHEALERLAAMDRRQAESVEMHFFGGLTFEEIAEVLGLSLRTVQRNWALCRAWLRVELSSLPQESMHRDV